MADREEPQLLGYLLEALDDSERESVEEQLAHDTTLQNQLLRLREALRPLQATRCEFDPPAGLAKRTCRRVASYCQTPAEAAAAEPSQQIADKTLRREPLAAAVAPPSWVGGWSWKDLTTAAGILATATLLLFPAIENSRFNARVAACQDNLRQLGQALGQYSQHHRGYFPPVPQRGRLAAAGVFAPVLASAGYLESPAVVICPASPLAEDRQFRIPSLDELWAIDDPADLERLRGRMGGSYGYCLGFMENGRYHSPRDMGRWSFALMSDAPSDRLPGHQTLNHGGRGQNVLFEDFHAQFFTTPRLIGLSDHFFVNDIGMVAPGRHRDDSVIGNSASAPFRVARFRDD